MTVSSTTTKNSYSGDGSNTVFAYTFKVFDEDDLTVILRTDATGTETVQTITTNYTVSGVGDAGGGNVTFVTAPASGVTVVIRRAAALTQTTDYTPNDPFPAEEHENALDKLTFFAQQQQEELDRAIKLSRTNTMTSTEFTVGSTDRANKILGFDGTGELSVTQELGVFRGDWTADTAFAVRDLIKDTTNDNIYICQTAHTSSGSLPISTNTDASAWELIVDAATATTSATSAAASAAAAATSETNAATSETNAATSATNAAASEASVAADAAAAAASESAAATSATNAAASETAAATSATSAASSATSATASATTATTKAAEASTSASNAATSETNAATSAASASSSATAAASSATAAASSATSAASSATSAASAQTAAEAARDAIQQFYLGAQTSNPTVDGNGDPVTAGDWYFNTTDNTTRIYDGSSWNTVSPDLVGDITPQLGGNLDTNGNDILFGDNDKAVFGAGSDFEIVHTGTNTNLRENGTGNLNVWGDDIYFYNSAGTETKASYLSNGAVTLYYDNASKLATTSGGIDVTGTVTADGLRVDGTQALVSLYETDTTNENTLLRSGGGDFSIRTLSDDGNTVTPRFNVDHATGDISFYDDTGVTQGFFWDASTQRLGLGTTAPSALLHLDGTTPSIYLQPSADTEVAAIRFRNAADSNTQGMIEYNHSENSMSFRTNGVSDRLFVNSSGNVGIGTASPGYKLDVKASGSFNSAKFTGQGASISTYIYSDSVYWAFGDAPSYGGNLWGGHATNNELYAYTNGSERLRIDSSGDLIKVGGVIKGERGTAAAPAYSFSDDTDTGMFNISNADLGFSVGGSERARLTSSGVLLVGKTSATITTAGQTVYFGQINGTTDGTNVCTFNRLTDDGTLVDLRQAGTQEGTISVSGTTVSYNGGHLSRWSRLADNSKDTSIVKGTVMTNLDEMVEWGDEDNEQLNKMAVSSVEGDANVAGVFVNWDASDDWNDMNIAMTGDMVIRIAQGTTIARGDLLMSAGDGTAKPQGDDIVRSKTIAKVTSTHVSHTYDDGSYLVPCVLMAC